MEIIYNGKSYTWYENEELAKQPEETQNVFPELLIEFQSSICINEEFEQTGKSRRITLQQFEWNNCILSIIPIYMYPATHEKNGIVERTEYYIKSK